MSETKKSLDNAVNQLNKIMAQKKYQLDKNPVNRYKIPAYKRAIEQLIKTDAKYITPKFIKQLDIGKKMEQKLNHYLKYGYIPEYKSLSDDVNFMTYLDLMRIEGIGPMKAKRMMDVYNLKSINDLIRLVNAGKVVLPEYSYYGLKYYTDLNTPIKRQLITRFKNKLKKHILISKFLIAGSYRRGKKFSNDIDLLIKIKDDEDRKKIAKKLKKLYPGEILKSGKERLVILAKIEKKRVKLDIRFSTSKQWPFMKLYYTGSKLFNQKMRYHAKNMGYLLNQNGLYNRISGKRVKNLKNEKEIFEFLDMKYKKPEDREV